MSMKTKLPVDLVVTTALHEAADRFSKTAPLHAAARGLLPDYDELLSEVLARDCLCSIAHGAHLPAVLAALTAAGAPAEITEYLARYRAIEEQNASRARP